MTLAWLRLTWRQANGHSFSTETLVALVTAKTLSPSLRFIRFTEPVVIIDVTIPAAVRMTTSDTTLSETIFSIVPGKRFRMLVPIIAQFYSRKPRASNAAAPRTGSRLVDRRAAQPYLL